MNATAYGISKTGVSIQVAVKMLKGTVKWDGVHKDAQNGRHGLPPPLRLFVSIILMLIACHVSRRKEA